MEIMDGFALRINQDRLARLDGMVNFLSWTAIITGWRPRNPEKAVECDRNPRRWRVDCP